MIAVDRSSKPPQAQAQSSCGPTVTARIHPQFDSPFMPKRAAPHRGVDIHYGDQNNSGALLDPSDPRDPRDQRPSKTQLKQLSQDLQDLGVAVSALSEQRLARIDMSDSLRDAISTYRKTKSFEGRRRQMQYVGKLMRQADEDALREAVAEATIGSAREALLLHETERWRDELIAHDEAMTKWLAEHPDTDTQQLRSLVRAARRGAANITVEQRQPKAKRELFQFIKPMIVLPGATASPVATSAT